MKYSRCFADGSAEPRISIRNSQTKKFRKADTALHSGKIVERELLAFYIQAVTHIDTDC